MKYTLTPDELCNLASNVSTLKSQVSELRKRVSFLESLTTQFVESKDVLKESVPNLIAPSEYD